MPAKKSKPSKPAKSKASKAVKAPASTEPETLTEASAGIDQMPADPAEAAARQREPSTVQSLDELFDWLNTPGRSDTMGPLREAIEVVYSGRFDPARELATLNVLKKDPRFRIKTVNGINVVGLAATAGGGEQSTLDQAIAEPAGAAPTLGELVELAKDQPRRIAWKHDIGSSVLLLTPGSDSMKATIRNIANHGGYALYDLNTADGGTVDGVPASRIGRDLDAEGELAQLRKHIAVLERHRDRGRHLAQRHIVMQAEEKDLAEQLAEHRKSMHEVSKQLAEHARAEPGQQDLRDVVGEGKAGPSRGEKMAGEPAAAEDKLADAPPAAAEPVADDAMPEGDPDVVDLETYGLTVEQLTEARFEQSTASTGKPQVVKPITPVVESADGDEIDHGPHVVVDVQDGKAVLVAVYGKAEWKESMAHKFGKPLALPSDAQTEQLAKGGRWCGIPVKVGRATCYLGALEHALLVRLPPDEAEPEKLTGKDAAAGG